MSEQLLPSDHAFSQFLARMTPKKARADWPLRMSRDERAIERFFRREETILRSAGMVQEVQVWRQVA